MSKNNEISSKDIFLVIVVLLIIASNILLYLDIECKDKYIVFNYIARITNLILYTILLFYLITRNKKTIRMVLVMIMSIIILIGNLLALIRQTTCEDNKAILVIEKIAIILAILLIVIFILSFIGVLSAKPIKISSITKRI